MVIFMVSYGGFEIISYDFNALDTIIWILKILTVVVYYCHNFKYLIIKSFKSLTYTIVYQQPEVILNTFNILFAMKHFWQLCSLYELLCIWELWLFVFQKVDFSFWRFGLLAGLV